MTAREDKELVGIIVSEMDELTRTKASGTPCLKEERLNGPLSEVGYLKLYRKTRSARVYFTVQNSMLYMLMLDPNKRRTNLTDATARTLKERLNWAKSQ